jgi:hypothetical protein
MLKYLFTDGRDEIIAIELEPIRELSLETCFPGTKVRLIGPIEVRRGIWMLRRSNIEVLWTNTDPQSKMVPKSIQTFDRATKAILKPKQHFDMMRKVKDQQEKLMPQIRKDSPKK